MSYYHPTSMHPALLRHFEEAEHRLVCNPVEIDASGTVPALQYHNGPTIRTPKVVALYSGAFWADKAKNDQFLRDIVENGYLSAGTPQGFGSGTFVGSFAIPAPASHTLVDADCEAMITTAIGRNGIPAWDAATIYVLILPDGVSVAFTAGGEASCSSFCAYHSSRTALLYTVQPANTCPGCNQGDPFVGLCMTQAHEIAETCSDPYGTGWFNDQSGQENADEVAWIQLKYGLDVVQGYAGQNAAGQWVNLVGAYTPVVPTPQPGPKTATTTTLTVAPNPAQVGQAVTVRLQVQGAAPTGTIGLAIDGQPDLVASLDTAGAAGGTLQFPAAGTHTLGASYGGDAHNLPSQSTPLQLLVNAAPPPFDLQGTIQRVDAYLVAVATYNETYRVTDPNAAIGDLAVAMQSLDRIVPLLQAAQGTAEPHPSLVRQIEHELVLIEAHLARRPA